MGNVNFFDNGNNAPQPKGDIKIEKLVATPYPDRFRVHVNVVITNFQERPNLLLALYDVEGKLVSDMSVIATMHANMEFTFHIRNMSDPAGDYILEAELFYETRNPPQDKQSTPFTIPEASD